MNQSFSEDTIDDLMHSVIKELTSHKINVEPRKGKLAGEIIGASLQLNNPRARLSISETRGKPFSALGEFLWYLAGSNQLSFIKHYLDRYDKFSDDGHTIYGAYGPRLILDCGKHNQIQNIIGLLKTNPSSRKATIQLFKSEDITEPHNDVPCTCTLQFLLRNNQLEMLTYMRSNDAFLGLPHDIFSFTMIQELIAGTLDVDIGKYYHFVGSLHLYEKDVDKAKTYISEGYQSTKHLMPAMPKDDLPNIIEIVLQHEQNVRNGNYEISDDLNEYWKDIIRLLQVHKSFLDKDVTRITQLKEEVNKVYHPYIDKKIEVLRFND